MLDAEHSTDIPLQETVDYGAVTSNDIELFGISSTTEMPVEERVRVLIDPKPPKKGRLTFEEYYDRIVNKNMQEMEVDTATIEMATPLRHVRVMTEEGPVVIAQPSGRMRRNRLLRSQSARSHGARNLDWIIDAVAKGLDVDSASPHNRRKPVMHKCRYCGRVDKYPSKIKAHMRTHTGEKPFKCDICGMTFAQRTPMRLHVRRHLDQKPYICTVEGCDQRFVSGALLNYHQHTKHFMTKRYICLKGCGRFFASARNQRNHEARCFYNTEQAHDFGDAIYEHLVYNDQEEEEASENEPEEELEAALEEVETSLKGMEPKIHENEEQPQLLQR
ncbi:zinc finger, C2H2 type [Oesophagostomum dentatum]|uniref:Zinc finger, C2H2 type n=1 Tax=Oesophagostomum dentatum TaxID=61180 RepID=A0A0B1SXF3_OESDE|nr:zinc finger, C2H2 type [Oesophagostomum dentatum]